MSPSSSTVPLSGRAPVVQSHSRRTSTAAIPQQAPASASRATKASAPDPSPETKQVKKKIVHYTVFIRLPFPREDFEDPPPVDWTATKDRQLWKLISSASNSKDLDWEAMSEKFEVPLTFLLQQAAWLYERHFEGMRAQMKRLGAGASTAPSPRPEAQQSEDGSSGAVGMSRKGSNDPKMPPAINTQRMQSAGDSASSPATPRSGKPLLSRNPSTSTVTQSRTHGSSPRQSSLRAFRGSSGSQRRPPPPIQSIESSQEAGDDEDESAVGHDGASESDSEDQQQNALGPSSRVTRRPLLGKKSTVGGNDSDGDAEDDDEESSGEGYLPFATAASSKPASRDDPAATMRGSPKRQNAVPQAANIGKGRQVKPPPPAESSESSASSVQPTASSAAAGAAHAQKSDGKRVQRGALSPRQRAQLAQLSPRHKSGSEGSPSMGSSFSDLDDLSVTQSALEEALLSNMQHGSIGMGSRMSSLRDALGRK